MKVWIVAAGPGDPGLLTVRAKELIEKAKVIVYAGSLVTAAIIDLAPPSCEKIDSAGLDFNAICDVYSSACRQRLDVVRLHSGDPALFGAIGEQIAWLRARGIEFEIVPGVSSFLAAAAALGTELTVPGVSQTVVLTRMPGRTAVPTSQSLDVFCRSRATVCLFLSMGVIGEAVALMLSGFGDDVPAAVVEKASRHDQRIISGNLSEIPELVKAAGIRKTALLIAGPALGAQGEKSLLYDAAFSHTYRRKSK